MHICNGLNPTSVWMRGANGRKTVLQNQRGQGLNSVQSTFGGVRNEMSLPELYVRSFTYNMESCHNAGELQFPFFYTIAVTRCRVPQC